MPVCNTLSDKANLGKRVVIVDVFRSSNTLIELLHKGAERIIPVKNIQDAWILKESNPDWLLFGEREGRCLPGCDGDNSPTQNQIEIDGRTIILTTSGGTRCIMACTDRQDVYIGSFSNAEELVKTLHGDGSAPVSFWAIGINGEISAEEDILCANYLENFWEGKKPDFPGIKNKLLSCPGADRLRLLGQQADLDYCTSLDNRKAVPVRRKFNDEYWCFEL